MNVLLLPVRWQGRSLLFFLLLFRSGDPQGAGDVRRSLNNPLFPLLPWNTQLFYFHAGPQPSVLPQYLTISRECGKSHVQLAPLPTHVVLVPPPNHFESFAFPILTWFWSSPYYFHLLLSIMDKQDWYWIIKLGHLSWHLRIVLILQQATADEIPFSIQLFKVQDPKVALLAQTLNNLAPRNNCPFLQNGSDPSCQALDNTTWQVCWTCPA